MDEPARRHYEGGIEYGRLVDETGRPRLELVRTLELLERFLPSAPAEVLDVGGGPGVYAAALTDRGYRVRLVDALAEHVEHARRDGRFEADVGDARQLDAADERYDAVLLMGPLYHLTDRRDRIAALVEARRVLRPDGVLFAVAVSRYAPLFDGLRFDRYDDPAFAAVVERDLSDGQHRNEENVDGWFTTAFFHIPTSSRPRFATQASSWRPSSESRAPARGSLRRRTCSSGRHVSRRASSQFEPSARTWSRSRGAPSCLAPSRGRSSGPAPRAGAPSSARPPRRRDAPLPGPARRSAATRVGARARDRRSGVAPH